MLKRTNRILVTALLLLAMPVAMQALTVNVVDSSEAPVEGFRWLLEEDNSHDPQPGVHVDVVPGQPELNPVSASIHKSYSPTLSSGESDSSSAVITLADGSPLPAGRYVISVLPYGDWSAGGTRYSMGGTTVAVPQDSSAKIYVATNELKTGQMSIKVFKDDQPLNSTLEPHEPGLEGFSIFLSDPGGDISQDAFGNKLGATYLQTCDGGGLNPGAGSDFCDVDADGAPDVDQAGQGFLLTNADGEAFIQFLRPNTYFVEVVPPENEEWYQTTGAAARNLIPVSVRPNEGKFFTALGPASFHAVVGLTQIYDNLGTLPPGSPTTVTGNVVKGHADAPPATGIHPGPEPATSPCLVGLSDASDKTVYVAKCTGSSFSISGVTPGSYKLVIFDQFLSHLPVFQAVVADPAGGSVALGAIPTQFFVAEQEHYVFHDLNKNGFRDPNETTGIEEQAIIMRFRDGTVFSAFPTDTEGYMPFEELPALRKWAITEVDFARSQATGVTIVGDAGGPVTHDSFGDGRRNPLIDPATGLPYRTETGVALLEAFQTMEGQSMRFEWGKADYDEDINVPPLDDFPGPGDTDQNNNGEYDNNGGISGIVYYAVTRAEDEPRFAAGEEWEAGIPRVQVNLYRDDLDNESGNPVPFGDSIPDDLNGNGALDLADVDNHPFGWAPEHGGSGVKGAEDVDRNGNGVFDLGDAVEFGNTDSFDDNLPTGCVAPPGFTPIEIHGTSVPVEDCVEGLRIWNQAVPGVFDGGWAFGPGDPLVVPGIYIVEAAAPPGLKHIKEEDRNVDFGNVAVPALLPAECVGDPHTVPPLFSFLTKADDLTPLPGIDVSDPDNAAPFAGEDLPLCDRKKFELYQGQNAAGGDFFMFSDVPKSARLVGSTGDGVNTARPGDPNFGAERGLPWIPIAFFDYTEKEISRTYSDEFGAYEHNLPSSYDIDLATPTGVGPQIHTVCVNHAGPIPDPNNSAGPAIQDPYFDPTHVTTCFNMDFWSSRTSYLISPVQRKTAFAGATTTSLDCEQPTLTPAVKEVLGAGGQPAYVDGDADEFTVESFGSIQVKNPDFPGDTSPADGFADDPPSEPEFVNRDYGFGGTEGTVSVGDYTFSASAVDWTDGMLTVTVPAGATTTGAGDPQNDLLETGQLVVTRGDNGVSTTAAVTLTVGDSEPASMAVIRVPLDHATIQAAIDAADEDDLILVDPGRYYELPIITKNVRLQGAGAGTTIIDANTFTNSGSPLPLWQAKVESLYAGGAGSLGLVSGQEPTPDLPLFLGQEGPGILVSPKAGVFNPPTTTNARIDGFHIVNGIEGGAVYANTNARGLQISNNRLEHNSGNMGGAIRVGNSPAPIGGNTVQDIATFSPNPDVRIHNNDIYRNGSLNVGGGVSLYGGADGYEVTDNNICGNLSTSGGGGVGHYGLSKNGLIARNRIVFNEAFPGEEVVSGGGGGIEISGLPAVDGSGTPIVGAGSGSVAIDRNLIQGNIADSQYGGGLHLNRVNGTDLAATPYAIEVTNNFFVNNATGLAGGAISMQNTLAADIVHNTMAHNDSVAVSILAFEGGVTLPSTAQVAGVASRAHTPELESARSTLFPGGPTFSEPTMFSKNVLWKNRSFFWDPVLGVQENPAGLYVDLGVVAAAGALDPRDSVVTNDAGLHASNSALDPLFVDPYFNEYSTSAAPAEGGTFVQFFMKPTTPGGDYHLADGSTAIDSTDSTVEIAALARLAVDIDADDRSAVPTTTDPGADETVGLTAGTPPAATTASFTAVIQANIGPEPVPLTVQFSDTSTNSPTTWFWTFGDGGTSSEQNPVHVYNTVGVFDVELTVSNGVNSSTMTKTGFITTVLPSAPVAEFSGSPLSGTAPLSVDFTDGSSNNPTEWAWTFGDGGVSTAQNPTHLYTTPGTYTVALTATNLGGSDPETKVGYVEVTNPVPVITTHSPIGDAPVKSSRSSRNFGSDDPLRVDEDSTTYHSYLQFDVSGLSGAPLSAKLRLYVVNGSQDGVGVYSVSNAWTENDITFNNAPAIGGSPLDSFAAITTGDWIELDVTAAVSGNGIVSFGLMNFGDDGARFHSREGAFPPELVIEAPPAGPPPAPVQPVAHFSGTPLAGSVPHTVDFIDLSSGSPTSWSWTFGEGGTSTQQNPSYTYNTSGVFSVTLTATNGAGSDSIAMTTYVSVDPAPAVQTLEPDHDARVSSSEPNENFGNSDPLWVDEDSKVYHSYLKFDIQTLSGTVTSAKLRLYATNGSEDGVAVYAVSNDQDGSATAWTESNVTWNNAPEIVGVPVDSVSEVVKEAWVELDVTSAVSGNGVVSFGLANGGSDSARFNSKEGAKPPELIIETN